MPVEKSNVSDQSQLHNEPIRVHGNYLLIVESAGKIMHTTCNNLVLVLVLVLLLLV